MFLKRQNPYLLLEAMTGVRMGDRLLQVGCANGGRLGAVAAKVGLSGRAVAVVPDAEAEARARSGAENAGVLVDVHLAPATKLPHRPAPPSPPRAPAPPKPPKQDFRKPRRPKW